MTNNQELDLRIKAALDATQTETDLRKLKQLLRDLQSLSNEVGDTSSQAFQDLQNAAADLNDRLQDTRENLNALTGEPLENVSAGFNLLKDAVLNLDFDKATNGINAMATGIGKLSIGETISGVGKLTTSFVNLGKALLSNPIFALGAIVIALIANFDKLANAGGIVGKIFSTLGNIIETVKQFFIDLSDALGITGIRVSEIADKTTKAAEATKEWKDQMIDLNKQLAQAQNLATFIFDFKKSTNEAAAATTTLSEEIKKLRNENKRGSEELIGLFDEVKKYAEGTSKEILDANGNLLDATVIVQKQGVAIDKFKDKLLDITVKYNNLTADEVTKFTNMMANMVTKRYAQEVALQTAKLNNTKDLKLKELDVERQAANAIINEQEKSKKLADIDARDRKLRAEYEAKTRISLSKQIFEAENYTNKELSASDELRFKQLKFLYENKKKFEEDFNTLRWHMNEIADKDERIAVKARVDNYIANYNKLFERLPSLSLTKSIDNLLNETIDASLTKSKTEYEKYLNERGKMASNAATKESDDIVKAQQLAAGEAVAIEQQKVSQYTKIKYDADQQLNSEEKSRLKERYDLYEKFNDEQYELGKKSYSQLQADKLSNLVTFLDEEIKLNVKSINETLKYKKEQLEKSTDKDVRKKLYKEIQMLYVDLEDIQIKYTHATELAMKRSSEAIAKHIEDIKKQREDIDKEFINIGITLLNKRKELFTKEAEMDQSELERLSLGANKLKDTTEEKIDILREQNLYKLQALKAEELAEIESAKLRGEAIDGIEIYYAEKRKAMNAQVEDEIATIKIQHIERVTGFYKQGIEGMTAIADIAANMDAQRLKQGEKLSFKAASKQFVVKQALAATGVIVDTAGAIMKSVAMSPETGGLPFSAIAGAMGALQLAKILTTKFNYSESSSSGSVSGGGGSVTAPSAPSMATAPAAPAFSQGFLNTINPASYIQYKSREAYRQGSERVYVVESDITRTQKRVDVITRRSQLGP